jgi:hypothetical protein
MDSKILKEVTADLRKQEQKGKGKYGTTLDNNFTEIEMLQHAYEETLDTAMYLKKLINIKLKRHGNKD